MYEKTEYEEWMDIEREISEKVAKYGKKSRQKKVKLPACPVETRKKMNARREKARAVNCFQEIFLEILDERKLGLAPIQKAADIPWPTLQGWYAGSTKTPLLDINILKLAQFLNVSIEYLCFGIGDDTPPFNRDS